MKREELFRKNQQLSTEFDQNDWQGVIGKG